VSEPEEASSPRATSSRNGGRDHSGMVGDIERNQHRDDPFKGIDLTTLSVVDRNAVDRLRRAYRDEGKDGLVRALTVLAKTNPQLFMCQSQKARREQRVIGRPVNGRPPSPGARSSEP
jgi:hypothetical protein